MDVASGGEKNAQQVIEELQAELRTYRQGMPTCDKHKPDGGFRNGCLICGAIRDTHVLSRIDAVVQRVPENPGVSQFDVDYDAEGVYARVKHRIDTLDRAAEEYGICRACGKAYSFDENEPFAHCKCGTSEWGNSRPKFRIVEAAWLARILRALDRGLKVEQACFVILTCGLVVAGTMGVAHSVGYSAEDLRFQISATTLLLTLGLGGIAAKWFGGWFRP